MGIFGFVPYAFDGMSGRGIALMFLGMAALCGACIYGGIEDSNRAQERYDHSLKLWLSECGKPIEACAYDWDNSYTLRSIYAQRSGASS